MSVTEILEPATERETVLLDGALYDAETGEFVRRVDRQEFRVVDRDSAEWVLAKMAAHEAEIKTLELRLAAVRENIETQIKERQRRLEGLRFRFAADLEQWARENLDKGKKSVQLDYGRLAFRSVKGGVRVKDAEAALRWARERCPDAIKRTESFLITQVPPETKAAIALELATETAIPSDELTAQAFEVAPDREILDVKTGVA